MSKEPDVFGSRRRSWLLAARAFLGALIVTLLLLALDILTIPKQFWWE